MAFRKNKLMSNLSLNICSHIPLGFSHSYPGISKTYQGEN